MKSRPSGSNKYSVVLLIIMLCNIIVAPAISAQSNAENYPVSSEDSSVLDVFFVDYPCESATCEGVRAETLVEYYGADWCEPCESLELMIDSINTERLALIHHHPSINDQNYLNHSSAKFANQYRLIFIPSIVINSDGLLTGAGQGAELNQSIAGSTANFSGIDNLSITNNVLYWNTSSVYNLSVWKLEPIQHEFDDRLLNNTASSMITVDNQQRELDMSDWVSNSTSRLIFILQSDETQSLKSLSSSSTGDKELTLSDEPLSDLLLHDGSYDAAIVTFVILLFCLMPALISFRRLQKQVDDESE